MNNKYIHEWNTQGFCVINDFFKKELINKIINLINSINFPHSNDFGSINGKLEFPCDYDLLNNITLHPDLIKSCQQLLNEKNIRLIQSDIWSKKNKNNNKYSNNDQRIHMDYPNNYLTHPNKWDKPESVAIIIYYSDYEICGGCTTAVPKISHNDIAYTPPYDKIAGIGKYKWYNDKETVENEFKKYPDIYKFRQNLYNREIKIKYKPGTILFYRHDLWHRGTPVNLNTTRYIHNIGFKKANCDWITSWNYGWARNLCSQSLKLEKFISNASNIQKICLGIPDENSNYWTKSNIEAFNIRFEKKNILSRL